MSKCRQCGFELDADVRYCPNCATRVDTPVRPGEAADVFMGTISGTATVFMPERADSSLDLEAGKEFHGRYRIDRKLGQGAMGVVYLANDKLTGRQVALKLINPMLMYSVSSRERFLREGLIARDIRHKNVVAVYDVGETEGQYYLVMEYLPGETLRSWLHNIIQSGNDVPYETAEKIIRNILEGLDAAHASGVVHRDVKPENIMLTGNPEAGDHSLKILDFGIARAIDSSGKQVVTTTTSTGTALYMAPEQKTAADTVGPPADLYAVSAMFYELLLGVAPTGRWTPLSKEREDLPAGIDDVIDKGLSSRPRSRYQNGQEYLKAISEIQIKAVRAPVTEPIEPPVQPVEPVQPVQPIPPQRKKFRKGWIAIGAVVLFGIWLVITLVDTNHYSTSTQKPVMTPPPEPTPRPAQEKQALPPEATSQPAQEKQLPTEPPPIPPPVVDEYVNLQGTWYDELMGTGIALLRVVIYQKGNSVSGPILDGQGLQWGTFSGRVKGNVLDYKVYSSLGESWGRGTLDPDGNHMRVLVMGAERHILHRNHLPPY
jgi:serine/threonine protein kinase